MLDDFQDLDSILFIGIYLLYLLNVLWERTLEVLNHKDKPYSEDIRPFYSEEEYKKSKQYRNAIYRFGWVQTIISLLVFSVFYLLQGFAFLDAYTRQITEHAYLQPLLFFGILFLAMDILSVPFSLYKTFVIEEKFGFNKTTVKTFITDKLKGYLLGIPLGAGMYCLIQYFYFLTTDYFWLLALGVFAGFALFMNLFYTQWIVPLFNKLNPLDEGSLRNAIEKYAEKVGFPLQHIYVMDGSRRSSKANAYFSGMGSKKSIVLFDTLIENHTEDEIVAVLAHEVGHYKKKHTIQGLLASLFQMAVVLFLFSLLVKYSVLSTALGIPAEHHSFHIALITFGFLYSPISNITGIIMQAISRKNEYQADAFARETYNGKDLISALKKLSTDQLSNLHPHRWYVFFHYSHPPVLKRIEALEKPGMAQ